MRLLSWNTAGRASKTERQVDFIAERCADIVALQEVTLRTRELLRPLLEDAGLTFQLDTYNLYPKHRDRSGPRRYGILVACRMPLRSMAPAELLGWPERMLSVEVDLPGGTIEVHAAQVPPGSSNGWVKIETFEGIYANLARKALRPRILCGDFNSPREERTDGQVVTWGQRVCGDGRVVDRPRICGREGERWDAGERSVLVGLSGYDLPDVFRTLYGYERRAYSWPLRRKGTVIARRRFDHVFGSRALQAQSFEYLHEPRRAGLSDHAAVEVNFDYPSSQGEAR